jgi:hypothetical protein
LWNGEGKNQVLFFKKRCCMKFSVLGWARIFILGGFVLAAVGLGGSTGFSSEAWGQIPCHGDCPAPCHRCPDDLLCHSQPDCPSRIVTEEVVLEESTGPCGLTEVRKGIFNLGEANDTACENLAGQVTALGTTDECALGLAEEPVLVRDPTDNGSLSTYRGALLAVVGQNNTPVRVCVGAVTIEPKGGQGEDSCVLYVRKCGGEE